jgi:predicted amidophosphoribosyltransferase
LDRHSISSTFLGYDGYGNGIFDTIRSPMGEAIYRLKYRSDLTVLNEIIETVSDFLKTKYLPDIHLDLIIPIPPSKFDRKFQPVYEIARGISTKLGLEYKENLIQKKQTGQLAKNVSDFNERRSQLQAMIEITEDVCSGKNILLLDDLYQSGASSETIAGLLLDKGGANKVAFLALTKARI